MCQAMKVFYGCPFTTKKNFYDDVHVSDATLLFKLHGEAYVVAIYED